MDSSVVMSSSGRISTTQRTSGPPLTSLRAMVKARFPPPSDRAILHSFAAQLRNEAGLNPAAVSARSNTDRMIHARIGFSSLSYSSLPQHSPAYRSFCALNLSGLLAIQSHSQS